MKKILTLLTLLSFCILIYFVSDTYALFETKGLAVVEETIGRFHITINDADIMGEDKSFVVDTFQYEDNENVTSGKFAPGTRGYFDLVIDPSNTDVSVQYEIIFNFDALADVKGVTATVTPMNGDQVKQTTPNVYSGIFPLEKIQMGEKATLRVFIEWTNDEQNNEADSKIGSIKDNAIKIPITVHVNQYIGNE